MNLSFFIARRYFFAKKSQNAINIISIISVVGIAVATAAMICVLSGFNGFGGLVQNMFSAFDPDLKITAKEGKVFNYQTPEFEKALTVEGIQLISESLEENALFLFDESQVPVLIKGVSDEFKLSTEIEKLIIDGEFHLREDVVDYATIGYGLALSLGVRAGFVDPIQIYAPKRDVRINLANPTSAFTQSLLQIGGVFRLNQPEYDEQMAIIPIAMARELFRYENEVSSIDIKLKTGAHLDRIQSEIQAIVGDGFAVENRYEQQKESYRMLQIEKWVSFLILSLILLIAVFNIVGSLTMLIVEKQDDIQSLKNLGASDRLVTRIFLYEGWIISFIGIISGITVGLLFCLLQQHFGLLKLSNVPGAYVVDAYPVIVLASDVFVVFAVVSVICFLTVLYPVSNLKKKLKLASE